MKHHYGDMLERAGDYWTLVPNRERFAYSIENVPVGSRQITIATLTKDDPCWEHIFSFPNLEEVSLHEPSDQQLERIAELKKLRRLRITIAKLKNLDFLLEMKDLEEIVLEYCSGFSALPPFQNLPKLKSIHSENLRRVSDFSALAGNQSLRYLAILGTFDWKQPVGDFEFLRELPNLEYLKLFQVTTSANFPAFMPALHLRRLKRMNIETNLFETGEYALLSEMFPKVEGADWGPYRKLVAKFRPLPKDDVRFHLPEETIRRNHPEVRIHFDGQRHVEDPDEIWFYFTGKGAGQINRNSKKAEQRCRDFADKFERLRKEARKLIESERLVNGLSGN